MSSSQLESRGRGLAKSWEVLAVAVGVADDVRITEIGFITTFLLVGFSDSVRSMSAAATRDRSSRWRVAVIVGVLELEVS